MYEVVEFVDTKGLEGQFYFTEGRDVIDIVDEFDESSFGYCDVPSVKELPSLS